MKNSKLILKKSALAMSVLLGSVVGILGASASAHAECYDLSGSHRGDILDGGKGDADLYLNSLRDDGDPTGYLGVLVVKKTKEVFLYRIEGADNCGSYLMIPQQVTPDGEMIGVNDANPTSKLVQMNGSRMTLVPSGASNPAGFHGSIKFDDATPTSRWVEFQPGRYRDSIFSHADIEIPGTLTDGEADLIVTQRSLSGQYVLRERNLGMYTLDPIASTATGDYREYAKKMVIFIQGGGVLGLTHFMVMIEPNSYGRAILIPRH